MEQVLIVEIKLLNSIYYYLTKVRFKGPLFSLVSFVLKGVFYEKVFSDGYNDDVSCGLWET